MKKLILLISNALRDQYKDTDIFDRSRFVRWIWLSIIMFGSFTVVLIQSPIHIATGTLSLIEPKTLLKIVGMYLMVSIILSSSVIFIFKKELYKRYIAFFNGILLMLYIINTIPSNAALMNGEKIVNDWHYSINRLILMFVIGECISFGLWRILKYFPILLVAIVIFFSITDYISIFESEKNSGKNSGKNMSNEEIILQASTFSTNHNIIVIGIDMFQGSSAEEHFINYPEFLDKFDGFTFFSRAFSSYNFTLYSRASILSGKIYSADRGEAIEQETASIKDSFLTDLNKDGYISTALGYNAQGVVPSIEKFDWYRSRNVDINMVEYGNLFAAGIARLTGIWIKNPWNNDSVINTVESPALNSKIDTLTINEILKENISLSDKNKLLFMWWNIIHDPIQLDASGNVLPEVHNYQKEYHSNEIYLTLNKLSKLFSLLKDKNIYDNSLIVLVSDHGSPFDVSTGHLNMFDDLSGLENNYGSYRPMNFYNAMLFVKPPFASGKMQITRDTAWVGDVRELVNYYNKDFENTDPKVVEALIRANKPDIQVMYSDVAVYPQVLYERDTHKFIVTRDLYQIPNEIFKLTGVINGTSIGG